MKDLYCIICGKYRKFQKHKKSHIFEKTLVLSIICSKYGYEDEKILKKNQMRY